MNNQNLKINRSGNRSLNLIDKANFFERNPWIGNLVIVTIVLGACELGSFFYIKYDEYKTRSLKTATNPRAIEMAKKDGVAWEDLNFDNRKIYEQSLIFHPYRWFQLAPDYAGKVINIDNFGLRKGLEFKKRKKIGVFGGSTVFSIFTADSETIPSLLTKMSTKYEFLNYGIGAYNQTASLMNYIEQIRVQELDYVIFYDGVNEIGRMVEKYERGDFDDNQQLKNMGYYHTEFTRNGIEKTFGYRFESNPNKPYMLRFFDIFFPPQNVSSSRARQKSLSPEDKNELEMISDEIVKTYVHNIRMITSISKEYGVTPIFIWQPDIYVTQKRLTDSEKKLYDKYQGLRSLTKLTLSKIQTNDTLPNLNFFDLSKSLDSLNEGDHFFDYCHLNSEANRKIAESIFSILNSEFDVI